MGGTVDGGIWVTTYQGQSNLTSTRGSHTWRGGVDVQWAQRTSQDGAGNMGTFNYDNTYTRAADTTNVFPAQQIGLSLAAFMLGMPTSVSIADDNGFDVRNNYFGTFVQDTWRVEPEPDAQHRPAVRVRERHQGGEEPGAALVRSGRRGVDCGRGRGRLRRAIRSRSCRPASSRSRAAPSTRAPPGYDDRTWKPEALWMPRFSFGYRLGEKNVIKGGYGMYYDTLNARDWTPDQEGFDVTTTNPLSNDFGQTFALGDPRNGILPLADPFPVRAPPAAGTRLSRERARRRHHAGPRVHGGEPQPRALARAAVAPGLAARARRAGRRSTSPTPARTPIGRGSPSARTSCPSSTGAVPTSATPRRTTSSPQNVHEPVLHRELRLVSRRPTRSSTSGCWGRRPSRRTTIQRQRLLRAFPHMNGADLQRPAAGHDQVPLARGRPDPAVRQRPHRQRRVLGEPGDREPDGRTSTTGSRRCGRRTTTAGPGG